MTVDAEQVRTEVMAFGPLSIQFDQRVLRPRPWTVAQSIWAAEILDTTRPGPVLELCAGVGHIGLLAVSHAPRTLVLVDAAAVACEHAKVNAARAGVSTRVDIRCGRMDEVLGEDERFVLVIADPPWVPSDDTGRFPDDPLLAIDGGADGLGPARTCLDLIGRHLDARGSALLQLGTLDQVAGIDDYLLADHGLQLAEYRSFDRGVLVRLVRTEA